jgi:multiple sugar transport system permease protein
LPAFLIGGAVRHQRKRTDILPYVLLSPAVVATLLVVFVPIVQAASYSLMSFILWKPRARGFIFLQNYAALLTDPVFWISLKNSLVWIVGVVALQLLLGLGTALLLNRDSRWSGIARALILIPWVTPSVITALMWRWMYDGNAGVINDLLVRIGLLKEYFPFLANGQTALGAIMVALMWQGFPFFAIMILAGLQAIPLELYEAANVDGAGPSRKFFGITLPMLMPILFTAILLRIIWVANSLDIIFIMTEGGPGYSTYTLPLYSYLKAYKGMDFGYGSTLAVTITILLAAVVAFYVARTIRSEDRL